MIRQVGRWLQRTPGAAWNATGGAQQIEPGSANETGLIFVTSAMRFGPEGWRLNPVDGRWAPGHYNISTTSMWAVVVAVERSHFQRFTSAASLNAQARYEIFLMHVVAAAFVLLVLLTLVAFMVARLISIPVNDLRARMEIVQSDEFVSKITKGPEDSHISEIRTIQKLLNVTVDRLILFDKYVPVTVRQQLTSQLQNDRKIAGNLWMELRQITIIHTCLDGFAQLRELTSMDAMLHLNKEYASQAMEIIEVLGGTIEDVSGDKIVSFWMDEASGCPNHAELACQAVLRMQDAANDCFRRWRANGAPHASKARQIKLHFSAGILTTDTFVGNFGTPTRLRYGVSGDGISQSLRLLNLTRIYNAPIIATHATLDGAAYLTIAAPQKPERVIVTASATQVDRGGIMTEGRGGGMRPRPSRRAGDGRRGGGHIDEGSVASFGQDSGGQDGSWSFGAKRTAAASPESTGGARGGGACAAPRCSVLGCLGPRARTGGEEEAVPSRQEEAPANPGYLQMVKGVKAAFHWSFVAKVPAMESSMRFNSVAENDADDEAKAFVDIYQLKGRKEADDFNDLRRDLRSPPTRSHIGTEVPVPPGMGRPFGRFRGLLVSPRPCVCPSQDGRAARTADGRAPRRSGARCPTATTCTT
jgi:class 3 adenylate cyclase